MTAENSKCNSTLINLQIIFDSAAYQTGVERVASNLLRECKGNPTEATIASAFERQLFYFVKTTFFGIDLNFNKEVGSNEIKHKFIGRMDAVSNGVVIEYKRPAKFSQHVDIKKAISQLEGYLCQLQDDFDGIVTDGQHICFVTPDDCDYMESSIAPINRQTIDSVVRLLIGSSRKAFVSKNVLANFTLNDHSNPTYRLAQGLFAAIKRETSSRTMMLYEEWLTLFHLSDADNGKNKDIIARRRVLGEFFSQDFSSNDLDYKALFALQTTYAIVVKLIACKVIGHIAYRENIQYFSDLSNINSEDLADFLRNLEDGYVYTTGGVHNLLEGDFFSWYCDKSQWTVELFEPIRNIISQIETYAGIASSRYNTLDVFKDLYMDFIPKEVRHSLGEYYTPDWLADQIVDKAITRCNNSRWCGVDPCCGSGVFVLSMIRHIIGNANPATMDTSDKDHLVDEILSRVAGVDINPLSVLTARVNVFLAISPFLSDGKEIEIPIYVGDSAIMSQIIELGGIPCYSYEVVTKKKNIKAILPCSFVNNSCFLEKMNELQTYVKSENQQMLYAQLESAMPSNCLTSGVRDTLSKFARDLVDLHKNGWDGIWIRIISNFMLVARIGGRDIIVGNPPWVKWEYLPEEYAKKLKAACLTRRMFSGQKYMGAISLNICAVISIVTASSWLTEKGVLAFLMPRNLLTQDSYEGFRNFYLHKDDDARLYLQTVDIWPKSGKLFGKQSLEPCATFYYASKYIDYSKGFDALEYLIKPGTDLMCHTTWQDASKCLTPRNLRIAQISPERTGYSVLNAHDEKLISKFHLISGQCAYRVRTGVEFVPNEVTFLRAVGPSNRGDGYWRFINVKLKASLHKTLTHIPFDMETKFVYPLLTAPMVKEFALLSKDLFCLFPYNNDETLCVPQLVMQKEAPLTLQYLYKHQDLFKQQSERSKRLTRGDDFYALSKVGIYTYAPNRVVLRDNTRMSACVVPFVDLPWGGSSMPIAAKHAPIISTRNDKRQTPITKDEAYYITGILNTPIIREWFSKTYSDRSYSINFKFALPLYNRDDSRYVRIEQLSETAHDVAMHTGDVGNIEKEIELIYLDICSDFIKK